MSRGTRAADRAPGPASPGQGGPVPAARSRATRPETLGGLGSACHREGEPFRVSSRSAGCLRRLSLAYLLPSHAKPRIDGARGGDPNLSGEQFISATHIVSPQGTAQPHQIAAAWGPACDARRPAALFRAGEHPHRLRCKRCQIPPAATRNENSPGHCRGRSSRHEKSYSAGVCCRVGSIGASVSDSGFSIIRSDTRKAIPAAIAETR